MRTKEVTRLPFCRYCEREDKKVPAVLECKTTTGNTEVLCMQHARQHGAGNFLTLKPTIVRKRNV